LLPLLGLTNSIVFHALVLLQMAFGSYEVGVIQRTPVPNLNNHDGGRLGELAFSCVESKQRLDRARETSRVYYLPAVFQTRRQTLAEGIGAWHACLTQIQTKLSNDQRQIDEIAYRLYGIHDDDRQMVERSLQREEIGPPLDGMDWSDNEPEEESAGIDHRSILTDLTSYFVGCTFGRFD